MDPVVSADNVSSQADEIEALSAIYQEDWIVEDAAKRVYKIVLNSEVSGDKLSFQVTLPPEYPSEAPPFYEISAPWMSQEEKARLLAALDDYFYFVFVAITWVKTSCTIGLRLLATHCMRLLQEEGQRVPVTRRKQLKWWNHCSSSLWSLQVEQVLDELKTNKKIAEATHNIWAYRIALTEPRSVLCKDSEDDGETNAGNRLLHLLDILNVTNVVVVVTRWYGGIHLGPDRFKHINHVARDLLEQHGYIRKEAPAPDSKSKGKQKKVKSKRT
ncbi:protein IMPACT-B-like isoform X3 [Haemaphysalis longicornis]